MRTLYIHVGPAKTGTTAIQQALLSAQGTADPFVIYPQVGLSRGGSHNHLVANLVGDQTRPDVVRVEHGQLLADLRQAMGASGRDVVISSEALAGKLNVAGFIETLAGLFDSPVRVEWLTVCREHFARTSSAYNQRVKDGWLREREPPDDFLRGRGAAFRYQEIIRRLRATGIPVTALNYHPAESLVERFLRHVGFPQEQIPQPQLRNISLSAKGLVATLAANNVAATTEDRARYFTTLRKMRRFFAPSKSIFSAEATREVAQRLAADREFLAINMGVALPEPDVAAEDGGLHVDEGEYAEICQVTRALGEEGEAINAYAARFRRSSP
jgi:hypothetical protein